MSEPERLLDTSTLSEVMRQIDPGVRQHAADYLATHGCFKFSILTRFEVLRGLRAKSAHKQIERFELRCAVSEILPLDDDIVVQAADIYADLRGQGKIIDDMDILIAATALVHGVALITENAEHFQRISGLAVESWRAPIQGRGLGV